MKTRNYMLVIASVFALVLALGFASSATPTFTSVTQPGSVDQGQSGTLLFKITDGAGDGDLTAISFNIPILLTLTSGTETFTSATAITGVIATLTDATESTEMPLIITIPSTQKAGIYTGILTVSGTDGSGSVTADLVVTITIVDVTKPVITTVGSNVEIAVGDTYTDAGANALDETDGDLTPSIQTTIKNSAGVTITSVDTNTADTYTITYSGVTDIAGNPADAVTRIVTVTNSFCTAGSNYSDLELEVDISNKGNGDDDKWLSLDTIEVEVDFTNGREDPADDGLYDLEDVTFEIGIYKQGSSTNIAKKMIWLSEDEEKFEFGDVDEGDDAKHVFKFRVDPSEELDGNYIVMIKVDADGNNCISFSDDLSGSDFGTSKYYASVDIEQENDKDKIIVIDTENFPSPATASCEQEVTFTADVWNIGDKNSEKYAEDQIKVTLLNTALGVNESVTVIGDLDAGDKTQVTFTFNVPEGMTEKTYNLGMRTYYDYDVDKAIYDKVSDDEFIFPLKLEGNCATDEVTMTASLESGGQAGQTLVVKATVTNTGTEDTTYTFTATGYSGWASSASINNTPLTLAAGQSGEILVSFEVDRKASGDNTFSIETYSEGELLLTQPVQVAIEGRKGLGFNGDNSAIAILIALISAIAIAIIIVLIVRASKRKA